MATFRLDMNRRAIRDLAAGNEVGAAMEDAALVVSRSIRSQRRGHVASVGRRKPGPRVSGVAHADDGTIYARVDMNDPGWALLEYGTATTPALRPVMRGVQASGARWEDVGP